MSATSKKPLTETYKLKPEKEDCLSRCIDAIWSIRYKRRTTAKNDEMFLKTTIRNFVLYIIFIAAATIMNYGFVSLLKFYISDGLTKMFIETPYNDNKDTFKSGFKTHDDVWLYLNTTLANDMFPRIWYDGNNITDTNDTFLQYQNKLMGEALLTQFRIQDNSCLVPKDFQSKFSTCRTQYDPNKIENGAFGLGLKNINKNDLTYSAWFYSNNMFEKTDRQGQLSTFPAKGYEILLGSSFDQYQQIISDLRTNKWIDLNTRLISVDFAIYNGNINLFSQIRLIFEFPACGGIIASSSLHTVKLLRYVDVYDYFIMASAIVFALFIIFYTIEEALDIRYNKWKYFKDVYNLLDVAIILLSYISIPFSWYRDYQITQVLDVLLQNQETYQSFSTLSEWSEIIDKLNAIVLFLCWMKIFKFVSINRTLNQLNETLGNSASELMSFTIIFLIAFLSFGGCGFLLFGEVLSDYQTIPRTMFTLFRILLGDFDFKTLRAKSPVLGPLFFILYVNFGLFILMNMFVAIINNSYTKVKEENAKKAPEFMISDYLKLNYSRIVDKLTIKKNRIFDIENILNTPEFKDENIITFSMWRKALKSKGYADPDIETIFSKYDVDGDRVLCFKEKLKLLFDIQQAKSNVVLDFQQFKNTLKDTNKTKDDLFHIKNDINNEKLEKFMSYDNFQYTCDRLEKNERVVANIIQKIDKLFLFLEILETEKLKRRQDFIDGSR